MKKTQEMKEDLKELRELWETAYYNDKTSPKVTKLFYLYGAAYNMRIYTHEALRLARAIAEE